jgi:hypothetical protein
MKKLIAVLACTSLAIASGANAQTTQFYDSMGRDAGSASTKGGTTTFRDSMGRETGSATTHGGTTTFRDRMGRDTGSAIHGE